MEIYNRGGPSELSQVAAGLVQGGAEDKKQLVAAAAESNQKNQLQEEESEGNPAVLLKRTEQKKIQPHSKVQEKSEEKAKGLGKLVAINADSEQYKDSLKDNSKFMKDGDKRLSALKDKLFEGMSKKDLLALIRNEFKDPIEGSRALKFLSDVVPDNFKAVVMEAVDEFHSADNFKSATLENDIANDESKKTESTSKVNITVTHGPLSESEFKNNILKTAANTERGNLIILVNDFKNQYPDYKNNFKNRITPLLNSSGRDLKKITNIGSGRPDENAHMINTAKEERNLGALLHTELFFDKRFNTGK